ncbi:MAG: tetratricopeptide repeat protein, partial [Candidatus Omnitrophica bacterium]|nr:tetratricopeptide repeat protein [Candidatus Omnitrophota bacterium]
MKKIFYIIIFSIFFKVLFIGFAFASSVSKMVKDGNSLYSEAKYEEALKKYEEAQEKLPDSDIINFNKGTLYYKKGDYEKAVDQFTKVLVTEDPKIESKVNYNLGNSKYKKGQITEREDLEGALNVYKEALEYYKRAIDLEEGEQDFKFNYEFLDKKIKVLEEKLKQQKEEKKDKDKDKDKEEEEDKEEK